MSLACLLWAALAGAFAASFGRPDQVLSRLVSTRYGRVQGFVRHHSRHPLRPVEVFLGVPYASPPSGDGRFTPTSSPLPWEDVRRCTELPPSCPQPLGGSGGSGAVPPAREAQIGSFRSLLRLQSEDCLYLNIYSPHDGGGRYPVMVYIHGENFSWGSGSLYDGSVLAAYGQVTVVTVNYRLGPLGFLNTSPNGSGRGVVGNQGLMDQLAALSWISENIARFGGDPNKVTLFGHSSGAACINYLIVSPVVVPGLFQRAVLMSGSALSPWAEVEDALSVTARLARLLNCSLPTNLSDRHPETMACLRNVSVQELVGAGLPEYKFASLFGPSVDGVVVPEDFRTRLGRVLEGRQLSVMFGVTEADGYPELNAQQATEGLDVQERNRLLRTYVRNVYHHHLQEIYLAITKEYTDWGNPAQHPMQVRDLTVEALSDGGYLAPLVRFGETLSGRADAYMYVFNHHEKDRQRLGSVFGSEVPLVFGAPFMDDPGHWGVNFTKPDALVSELMMRYWTNFAKSGDPNLPEEVKPILSYKERTRQRNITWEPYESIYEKFLEISFRPRQKDHYRAHKVALWNWLIPELEEAGAKYPDTDSEAWHASEDPKHFIGPVRPLDPFRFLHTTHVTATSPPPPSLPTPSDEYLPPNVSAAHGSAPRPGNASSSSSPEGVQAGPFLDYTTALTLTVAIGLSLLVLNAILFAALLYRRDRNGGVGGSKVMRYGGGASSAQPLCTVDSGMRSVSTHDVLSSPAKDAAGKASSASSSASAALLNAVDLQCTELHTFPTPPDIGDRNTEVTFHAAGNAMRPLLTAQPTSQFIPPPPLLLTAAPPPPPPAGCQHPGGEGGHDAGGGDGGVGVRCYAADVGGGGQYPDVGVGHYPDHDQYMGQGGGQCGGVVVVDQTTYVSAASPCASSSSQQQQQQHYCPHYAPSQYSSSTDQYSSISGSQFSSPGGGGVVVPPPPQCVTSTSCQFADAGMACLQASYVEEEDVEEDGGGGGRQAMLGSLTTRSATLQRGSSSSSSSNASSRKPLPPPRGSTLPSYATLPRHSSKDSISHINA